MPVLAMLGPAASASSGSLTLAPTSAAASWKLKESRRRLDGAGAPIFTRPAGVYRGPPLSVTTAESQPVGDDSADDELAVMQLMLEDKDLPSGWEFDGNDAKLNNIYAWTSARTIIPRERAAFMDGKRKELEEFFGYEIW
eukprot:9470173-Pyramimonas_sp.AAC.3